MKIIALISLFSFQSFGAPISAQKLMIAAPSEYAVQAGKEIYLKGGNVVDVAVASALALSVTSPYFAALGGGGFAIVNISGKSEALDFRETAPNKATPDIFSDIAGDASVQGGKAVGVPGIPMGLWALHKKYGKLKWSQLFLRPIALAKNGFNVSGEWVSNTNKAKAFFNSSAKKAFFKSNEVGHLPNDLLKQPGLAKLLEKFSQQGPKAFYEGEVAEELIKTIQASKGVMSLTDLKEYRERWLEPLHMHAFDTDFDLMPPPSSGGLVVATALKLAESLELKKHKLLSQDELLGLAKTLKAAFYSRNFLGDPDFIKNPTEYLMSDAYISKLAQIILDPKKNLDDEIVKLSSPNGGEPNKNEKAETTHLSVMDIEGHAVAMTLTLNGNYGSGLVTERFGIALNNEMDDFNIHPGKANMYGLIQGEPNVVGPKKRPLSSMSPTLVSRKGKVVMSLGSPGGPRIISSVFQVLYRKLVSGLDIDQAIQAPRLHHQFKPNTIFVDKNRFSPESLESLRKNKFGVEESWMGKVYGISIESNSVLNGLGDGEILQGAFDSRGEGSAGGI